jgi:hypothetical protein
MTNFARSSLALVLAALAGAAKSCALANIFIICPRWSASGETDDDQIMSLITAISWHVVYPNMLHIDDKARAKQWREAHGAPAGGGWRDCIKIKSTLGRPPVRKAGAGRWKKTGRGGLATSRSLDI